MGKYRKRPIVVEANQWWPNSNIPGVQYGREWVQEDLDGERIIRQDPYVVTVYGHRAYLMPGDWIVVEPDGGIHDYPYNPDEFVATYEAAE